MERIKKGLSLCLIGLLLILMLGMLAGCQKGSEAYIKTADQLNDSKYKIVLDTGSNAALDAQKAFPNASFSYVSSASDAYLAVSQGTADAFAYGKLYMQYAIASNAFDNLTILDDVLSSTNVAAGINPKRTDLVESVNAFIKQIQSDGTYEDMYNRWVTQADPKMPDIPKAENPEQSIRFGTAATVVPMNYYGENNELTGFDIEFMRRLALFLNADFTIEAMGFDSLIASLQSDRLDIVVSDLNTTEERAEVITFSDPYMVSETAVVVQAAPLNAKEITRLEQLNGKTIGCTTGSSYIERVQNTFTGCTIVEYNTSADLISALKSERIDAYVTDEPMAYAQVQETDGITTIHKVITPERYGFMLNLNNTALCNDMNTALQELKEQGVLDALKEKWVTAQSKPEFDTAQSWAAPNGVLRVGLSLDSRPFAYLQDEEVVGYDVELIYRIAEKLGYRVEITSYEFSAVIGSVASGREDVIIGCITYTPERAESVLFTDSTYDSGAVAVVLDHASSSESFLSKLGNSFERTFVRESRWKLVVSGLLVTLRLSILTLIFGTLIGFGFSFLLRSRNKMVCRISNAISTIIDGLPLLIILMVFYYIIFAKSALSAITIGVMGLSLDFANSVAGILNTGVQGVDKGQIEAAESMGYPRWKTFMKIVFPQAANHMFSQYTGSVIGMIKGTSIIGYITVVDLTKAGDIIRSLTYEAFFPLISIAAIYFILAQVIISMLKLIAKRLNPKHRKRQLKGVKIHD